MPDDSVRERIGSEAEGGGELVGPLGVLIVGGGGGAFGGAAVEHGFAFQLPPFPGCWVAVEGVEEAFELGVEELLHAAGTGREGVEHLVGHVGDLGDAVHRFGPPHTEAPGEFGP